MLLTKQVCYDGTPSNVNFNVAGKFGNAGEFNGSSSKVSTSAYGLSGNASYSASLWFKLGDTSGDQVLYSFGNTVAYQGSSLYIRNNNQIYHANNANADFFPSVPTLSAGVWYHFVLTYSSGSLTAYINNLSIGTVPISTGVLNITGNLGRIGCDIYDGNFINGSIDQVRIFNRAITATRSRQHFMTKYSVFLLLYQVSILILFYMMVMVEQKLLQVLVFNLT